MTGIVEGDMHTPTIVLSLAIAASAVLTIAGRYRESRWLEYGFKPLTTALILALALVAEDPVSNPYRALIALGLLASLAGDVFLMLPDRFLPGLVSFLVAHLFYIAAFVSTDRGTAPLWFILPFLFYGAVMLRVLWVHLGMLRGPVIVYMAVILLMGWMAANRWLETDRSDTLLALVGAYFFIASDSVLAVERFRGTWRSAPFWVLSTYYMAQWLIALSVGR